ncbi:MAG: hypothetical protein H7301_04750 [Cryobacterium sp.]|nr:hypothetical protein [Oligoflexia bacterium]
MNCEKRILLVDDDFTIYPLLKRVIHRLNPDVSIEFADTAELAGDLLKEDLHNPRYSVVNRSRQPKCVRLHPCPFRARLGVQKIRETEKA